MIGAIPGWLRSVGISEESVSSLSTANTRPERQSSLYRCNGCDTVYVATEMQLCSTCERSVEQVPVGFGASQKG
jgi:hypothetical protein